MSDVKVELPENSRIVQPNYLEKNSSKVSNLYDYYKRSESYFSYF